MRRVTIQQATDADLGDITVNETTPKREKKRSSKHQSKNQVTHAKKRMTRKRKLFIVGMSLFALLGLGAAAGYWAVTSSFNDVKKVSIQADPSLKRPAAKKNEATNILILGSDSRKAMPQSGDLSGFRSDVIMVAQISPDRKHATVMSIMRDNWVDIQGRGPAKINAAFAYGGLPLVTNTVENFIGARIDHVAVVDFESFQGLTQALGGVTVNNELGFTSMEGATFAAGPITLQGKQALQYVRERYAFSDGDYQRVKNQQAFMKGLLGKIVSKETLSSPAKIGGIFDAVKPYVIVDEGLTLPVLVKLGLDSRNLRADDINFFTSPTLGTGRSPDGQSIVIPDEAALAEIRKAFAAGTLDQYFAATQGQPATPAPAQ